MWALVINPVSGQGKGTTVGTYVAGYLNQKKIAFTIVTGKTSVALGDHLRTFLHKNAECEGIIAVGGDGLMHLVVQIAVPAQIPFTIIPAGTGNDFVRTLGWSLDSLDAQLSAVVSTHPSSIDLGLVDGEWFGAILSTGFDSVVNERANSLRWPRGPQRYNLSIALELPSFTAIDYQITTDTESFTTKAMLIAIGNGRSYGGGMLVCPQANMHDGLFDVMILEPVSKLEFIKVFPKVYSGSHITHPAVRTLRTKRISLSADAIAYADGERIGPAPISAECVPSAGLTWTL